MTAPLLLKGQHLPLLLTVGSEIDCEELHSQYLASRAVLRQPVASLPGDRHCFERSSITYPESRSGFAPGVDVYYYIYYLGSEARLVFMTMSRM